MDWFELVRTLRKIWGKRRQATSDFQTSSGIAQTSTTKSRCCERAVTGYLAWQLVVVIFRKCFCESCGFSLFKRPVSYDFAPRLSSAISARISVSVRRNKEKIKQNKLAPESPNRKSPSRMLKSWQRARYDKCEWVCFFLGIRRDDKIWESTEEAISGVFGQD